MGSKKILLLGIFFGLIAGVLAYMQLADDEEEVVTGQQFMKLNADQNLAVGDRLLPDMVSAVTIPLDFTEVESVAVKYTPEIESWLANNDVRVSRDIYAGSFILHEHLLDDPELRFANIISEKGRAISIPVSEITSVSYFVEPGSRVDILTTLSITSVQNSTANAGFLPDPASTASRNTVNGSFGGLNEREVTRTILQNMQVLAVGQATTRNAYLNSKRGYRSITLDVTAEEAEMLTFIMSQSKNGFSLVLRNPSNSSEEETADVDWTSVTRRP